MRKTPALMLAAIVVLGHMSAPLAAQNPNRTRLTVPMAQFAEPFSSITGLRELSDGRVMVSDRLEKAVRILDFDTGDLREIGRAGSGPGEYQMPTALLPLPGDSTLLVDFGNMRLTVIDPEGRLLRSTSMQHRTGRLINPNGADASGKLYFDDFASFQIGADGPPDSTAVMRWDLAADVFDTVGYMPRPEVRMSSSGAAGGARITMGRMNPFRAQDAWNVAPDGRVVMARAEPYRIESCRPGHPTTSGPIVPYEPVRVTEEDMEEVTSSSAVGVMVTSGGQSSGGRTISIPPPDADEMEWPDVKPAFQRAGLSIAPDGTAWVRRYVAHGQPELYDVFDASGTRIRQVELPAGRRLLGLGTGVLYLVRADEDDLQWIEKYRR